MHWSHPWYWADTVKFWSQYLQYLQSYLKIFISHLASAVPLLETNNISLVCRYIIEIWHVLWIVPEKIAFLLQRSGTKNRYFIWAKRSTPWRAVMVHSARSIALLFALFDVAQQLALPSECKKPTWMDWTIKISPYTRWVLLDWFLARRSRFRVSHHTTILNIISTSCAWDQPSKNWENLDFLSYSARILAFPSQDHTMCEANKSNWRCEERPIGSRAIKMLRDLP